MKKALSIFLMILLSINTTFTKGEINSLIENVKQIKVVNVYPSSENIPENCLRFYIYFDSPMREGNALQFIKLYDENNKEMSHVFFDGVNELWTADRKRLTLLLDPGRVKTGLDANAFMGRAFTAGKKYKLVVEQGFEGLNGLLVKNSYEKIFTATREDRKRVLIEQWTIDFPEGNKDVIKINFKEAVDHVSAMHFILVVDHQGDVVPGKISLFQHEKVAVFKSLSPWIEGHYQILINHRFEDVAANNINGAFDHKVGSLLSLTEGEVTNIGFTYPLINQNKN